MFLNLSKIMAPFYGLSFSKAELDAKLQDLLEQHQDFLPKTCSTNDLLRVFQEFGLIRAGGGNYLFSAEEELYSQSDYQIEYSTVIEHLLAPDLQPALRVNVIRENFGQVGNYVRRDLKFDKTFFYYSADGNSYALYSPAEDQIDVISLPDCRLMNLKTNQAFCPVEFYVPEDPSQSLPWSAEQGKFGFVAGYFPGEDSVTRLMYLDLANVKSGQLSIEDRFGLVQLPRNLPLSCLVDLSEYDPRDPQQDRIWLAERRVYRLQQSLGEAERTKRLDVLHWVCPNPACSGQGEVVLNPVALQRPLWRCPKCLELVHDVGNNILIVKR